MEKFGAEKALSLKKETERRKEEPSLLKEERNQSMVHHVNSFSVFNSSVTWLGGDHRATEQQAAGGAGEGEKEVTVKVEKEEGVPSYRRET